MRATHRHPKLARAGFCAVAVAVITCLVAAPASGSGGASKTPLDVYKRFAFEFELGVAADNGGPAFTLATKGFYVGPRAQDCEVTASLGGGFEFSQHAVVIGNKVWFDDNGRGLKPGVRSDFDFETQCPSSADFWDEFSIGILPPNVHGTVETRDGVAVERIDITSIFGTILDSGLVDDVPPDMTAERTVVWASKRDRVIVGLDFALHANSSETCHDLLELDDGDVGPSTCTMTIRFDLSRFNDHKLDVDTGRGSSERINRT